MSTVPESGHSSEQAHILVLDDENSIRWVLERTLSRSGHVPHLAEDAHVADILLRKFPIRLAMIDINLPGKDGITFIREAKKVRPGLITIVMTGQSTMFNTIEAMKAGAYEYVTKPFDIDEIESLVDKALSVQHSGKGLHPAPQDSRMQDEALVGKSKSMRNLYKSIGRVAPTNLTVLIQGESGTGKELVARTIHTHSPRADKPFVAINCAAIPSELLESELFGHEKGAFTGAAERKRGKLELASQGTLFLDEIGDMPMKLQSKLLRVLQEKQFERLGGQELISTDMRVIAATHRNLEKLIEEFSFRDDLFYRLNVFTLEVSPLRERPEDIPVLTAHFLRKGSQEMAVDRKTIAEEAMDALCRYSWPGNVRELENIIKSLMITNVTESITLDSFPKHLLGRDTSSSSGDNLEELMLEKLRPLVLQGVQRNVDDLMIRVMHQVERPMLLLLLEQTRWNQQKTARILGINRNTLRKKIEYLGIRKHQLPEN